MPHPNELFSMRGKTCVVTGGHRGLGRAIAKAFLLADAKRVYVNGRSEEACTNAAKELSELGDCQALVGDIGTLDGLSEFAAVLSEREDKIDVLVNNAGTAWGSSIEDFPEKGWDKVIDLNVKSPFFLVQKLLPLLRAAAQKEQMASVINIGSVAGIVGNFANAFSYTTSKAAIHQLTRNLAHELADDHIRVNAIAPGRFHSKMTESVPDEMYQAEVKAIPLHRWGSDPDIMGVALLLASQAGAFITGQIVNIDGGATLL
ncbi:MAG: SDR family oxidoreductase [Henriciella sp.]|nr:SDR family oxidoreductase [Henriciella sp.]